MHPYGMLYRLPTVLPVTLLFIQRLPREVIERIRQGCEGHYGHDVVVDVSVRQGDVVGHVPGGLNECVEYAHESHAAAGCDAARGEEGTGRDVALVFAAGLFNCAVDEPADDAAGEDGQRGADGEIRTHSKR